MEQVATWIDAIPSALFAVVGAVGLISWGLRDFHDGGCRHHRLADWCPWCWRVRREHAE